MSIYYVKNCIFSAFQKAQKTVNVKAQKDRILRE